MGEVCACRAATAETEAQRLVLRVALALNAAMFVIGLTAGLAGQSSGLIADALDMLADAAAYAIALVAIGRGPMFKARAGGLSGAMLLLLGLGVLVDVLRRGLTGSSPESGLIIGVATLSLIVNATVLHLLDRYRQGEFHMRATWIFTRADVVANVCVIISGLVVLFTGLRWFDLLTGAGIGLYVIKESLEILGGARDAGGKAK